MNLRNRNIAIPAIYDVGELPLSRIRIHGGDLHIVYTTSRGHRRCVALLFEETIAYRFTAEAYAEPVVASRGRMGQYVEASVESPWLDQLASAWRQSYGNPTMSKDDFHFIHFRLWIWDEGVHEIAARGMRIERRNDMESKG